MERPVTHTKWEQVEYTAEPVSAPAIDAFAGAITRMLANGGLVLQRFAARKPAAFDSAWGYDSVGPPQRILAAFLQRPEVRAALASVQIESARTPPFRTLGLFELEGALTGILLGGGAYISGLESEDEARNLSRAFVDALVGDNRRIAQGFAFEGYWTPWFHDVAWDFTCFVFDPIRRCWWTLFLTDTD
jgi:hypothetical protein